MFHIKTYATLDKIIYAIFNIFDVKGKKKSGRQGLNSRCVHIGFMVNKVALVHVFFQYLYFPQSASFCL
jgi:hypothetical protein